jgi:hypothetical protein
MKKPRKKKSLVSSWEGPFFLWNIQMGKVFLSKMKEDAFVSWKQMDDRLWDKLRKDL